MQVQPPTGGKLFEQSMTESSVYQGRREPRVTRPSVRGLPHRLLAWGDADAEPVFYLHGWGDTGASFQFLVDELEKDWFVIAPDWRGFGLSHFRCESYWFPDYVADLDALLRIYQPDEPVNLLGHSMGANAAGIYAGIFPERVSKFVNVEGFGLADSDPDNAPSNYRRWIEQSRSPRWTQLPCRSPST